MSRLLRLTAAGLMLLAAGLIATAPHAGQAKELPAAPRNVILVSWDGFDRSVLKELLKESKLPNLAGLAAEGSLQEIQVAGHATVTKPGHAEMLTGLDARTTGVFTNGLYQPIPEGYTVFERLQQQFGREKIRTIMLSSKIAHVGGRSAAEIAAAAGGQRKEAAGTDTRRRTSSPPAGEPFYLTRKHLDVFDSAQRDAAESGPLALKYLSEAKGTRFFAFLHFSDPDHQGHRFGIDSPEYRQAAITCDQWLGKILEYLKQENLYGVTLLYVTTDHGFDAHAKSHQKAPDAWLATNDRLVKRDGLIADVPATILARFGLNIPALEPKLLGADLAGPVPDGRAARLQELAAAEPKPTAPAGRAFQRRDLNGDGRIGRDDNALPKFIKRLDTDKDGFVSLEEFRAGNRK